MKKAVVTGAGSGIGRHISIALDKNDFTVFGVGRNIDSLQETGKLCTNEFTPVVVDVTDRETLYKKLKTIKNIDVLIAGAGVCERTEIDDNNSDAVFDRVMNINVTGVWNTFKAVVPNLNRGAATVIISSGLGKLGRPGYSAYAASKHAVLGITKCLAMELASKQIRVNAICPGWVNTGMAMADLDYSAKQNKTSRAKEYNRAVNNIALGRFVETSETAELLLFLTSSKSSAITGQSYNISCGEFFV